LRRRKGVSLGFFAFMAAFVVAGALVNNFMFNQYASSLELTAETSSQVEYNDFGRREEVLNAECITRQRGIFIKDQIDNAGALTCIAPAEEPFVVTFHLPDEGTSYSYRIEPQGPGEPSDVSPSATDLTFDDITDQVGSAETYPITVYDQANHAYSQGTVTISG